MTASLKSYATDFFQYFQVSYASEEWQKEDVGRIRYNVYCQEFGYEPASAFPAGIEQDSFDASAWHCLVTHRASQAPAGCVRIVRPSDDNQGLMPFEKYCHDGLDTDFFRKNDFPRESVCELSRLAVNTQFRRRAGEQATRFGEVEFADFSQQERRTFPLVTLACFLAATALTDIVQRPNAFAMMEPFLPRLLARSGISFIKVGHDLDYHGQRAPYFCTHDAAVAGMVPELRAFYDLIYEMISETYQPNSL